MILEPLKNQFESWKSPGNLFLTKGTNPVQEIIRFRVQFVINLDDVSFSKS